MPSGVLVVDDIWFWIGNFPVSSGTLNVDAVPPGMLDKTVPVLSRTLATEAVLYSFSDNIRASSVKLDFDAAPFGTVDTVSVSSGMLAVEVVPP